RRGNYGDDDSGRGRVLDQLGVRMARSHPTGRWRMGEALGQAVIELPAARGAGGRPLHAETPKFLRQLSAWRNFLAHGDANSHARLATYGVPVGEEGAFLTAEPADWTIIGADAALTDAGAVLGVHGFAGLHSAFSWVAADEK